MKTRTTTTPGTNGQRPRNGFAHELEVQHRADPFRRDPALIGRLAPWMGHALAYFTPEVHGLEHVPVTGPALVVGNHSGVFFMPDAWEIGMSLLEHRGLEQEIYVLAHDVFFAIPGVGPFMRRIGALPADPATAEAALRRGALVLVFPGGAREACRPWTERNTVELGGHHGFVRLAHAAGVPIVPVVAHGSHESVVVVWRGSRLARMLGLGVARIDVCPILLGPPFGLNTAATAPLPMPATISVEFLAPHDVGGPGEPWDEETVDRHYEAVAAEMQAGLDRLAEAHPHPVVEGVGRLSTGLAHGALRALHLGG